MDPPITYQQLLAEQYADNATQLLAFQQTEYYDDSDIDAYGQKSSLVGNDLTDAGKYQEFAGNRNKEENIIKVNSFEILSHVIKTKNVLSDQINTIQDYLLFDY